MHPYILVREVTSEDAPYIQMLSGQPRTVVLPKDNGDEQEKLEEEDDQIGRAGADGDHG
jgi:hypothetical protein